jgi:ribosomal protein S18 acetylase RimI-like enzyme
MPDPWGIRHKRFEYVDMNVELLPARPENAEALAAIQKQAFRGLYEQYHDEGSPYLRGTDEILRWLERSDWHVFKIHADGALCGGISVCQRPKPRGEFYLARIYVSPELRGRGIAPAAIALCEARFPRARHWLLDFPTDQTANRRCYEKAGYVDTGERREQSGGAVTLAIYEKRVK